MLDTGDSEIHIAIAIAREWYPSKLILQDQKKTLLSYCDFIIHLSFKLNSNNPCQHCEELPVFLSFLQGPCGWQNGRITMMLMHGGLVND